MKKIDNLIVFRMRKLLLSMKDHWYLLFKSASHNHLRIQEIRRGENGGIFCTFSFYSYTALKRYQKKVRVVSFGLTSGLAIFLVALVLVPAFFNPSGSKAAGEIPTVSSVAPNMGPTVGGTNVTITGSNFDGVSDAETKLLIHGDGLGNSIVDHSLTPKTVTVAGNTTQSATLSKFGGKSIYFDGSGDYLQLADSDDFDFGAGDYAIDFWAKTSTFDYNYLFSRASGGYPDFSLQTYPGGELRLMIENGSDSAYAVLAVTTGAGLNDGNFHHIALVRNSGNTKIYIDGVSKLSIATAYNVSFDTAFRIGAEPLFPPHLTGYIDEFRITKGISRWTDNFTPSTGAYFQPSVTFGGTLATNISLTSSTILLATTPSHVVGEVDVVVTNYDGGIGTLTNGFTYNAPLMVTSILPNNASKNGGDSVTITGNGFYGNPNVKIGGTDAININVVNATTITATTPAHVAGIFDVVVTNEDEQSGTLPSGFTFNELAPIVSSINPNSGPVAGGTDVTISGSNFLGGADENTELLLHGDGDGATFVDAAISPKTITANGDAIQSITTSKFGKSSMYFDGNGDYLTAASSSDFDFSTGDYTVDFWVKVPTLQDAFVPFVMFGKSWAGDNQSQWIVGVSSANKIEATHTNSSGTASYVLDSTAISANTWYHIALVRSGGLITLYKNGSSIGTMNVSTSYALQAGWYLSIGGESELHYTRLNGYIDEIRISKGVAYWTNNFTVATSQYFLEPSVTMGGLGATGVLVTSPSTIIATTPAHVSGMIDVMVTNSDGQNDTLENGFAYIGPPTISSINPITTTNNQSVSGIDISGTGFQDGATVKFKKSGETDIECTNVIFNSSSSLSCDGDFHGVTPGDWDVEVANVDGQIGTASNALNITGEVTQINFTTPNYTIKPNVASQSIRIQLQDSAGRETLPAADTLVDLSKNSATGEFSLSRTSWSPITSVSFTTLETTKNIYYKDSTSGSHTIGASENPSDNWTDASQSITVNNVAPYVWPFDAAGDYTYDGAKISIANSDANLLDLAAVNPEIKNAVSASLTYSSLTSFSEVLDFDNQGSVKYQLSNDDGVTWHWWNGSTWAVTTQGVTQSNDAATINTQISRYNSDIGQIGNAKLSFKAFLIGDGAQKVSLDSIFVGYGLFPYKYALIENPTSLNETEVGTFTVQAQDQNGNVIAVDHDTVVSLGTSAPSTGFFATDLNEDISTRWDKQLVTIPEGQNSATFYYKDSQKGTPTLSITPPIGEETLPINYPLAVISRYRFLVTGVSDPIQAGVPSSVTIQAADYLGNPVTSYTGNVHFTSSDAASSLPADNVLTAPMLGGKTYVNGVTMMTQAEQCVTVTDESDSIITGSQCAITVTAPPAGVASKLKIISNQQFVPVGEVSSSITVQLQDINNSPAVKSIPTTVYVYRTTASGQFSEDGFSSWTSAAFSVIIPAGATSANFFYMDSAIGNYVMTVSDDNVEGQDIGLTNDSQQLSAVAGSPASFSFNSSPAIIAGVATGALNFSLHDSLGNQVTTQSNQAAIITSSNGGEFSLDGSNNWTNKLFTGISTGDYENDFYYRNNTAGSDTITISDSDPADGIVGLNDVTANVTVNSSAASQYVFLNSPVNLNVGETSSQLTIQARDVFGNVATVSSDTDVYLYSNDGDTTFSVSASPFTPTGHITIPNGGSTASFYFKQSADNGSIIITASDNSSSPDGTAGIFDVSQTETISQGAVTDFVITNISPVQLNAGDESSLITVESRNILGVTVPLTSDTTVYFHSDSTASLKEFSLNQSPSWSNISSVLWASGNDTLTFYYKDTESGNKTITVGDDAIAGNEAGIINAGLSVDVSPLSPTVLKITSSPLTVEAGERGQLNIEMQDEFGNQATEITDRIISLSSDDNNGIFTDADSNPIITVTIPAGNSTATVYYKNNIASSQNLTMETSGLTSDTQEFVVVSGAPVVAKLSIVDPNLTAAAVSGRIQASLYNAHDVATTAPANLFVNISNTSATGKFDTNPAGAFTSGSLNLAILAGASGTNFYYKDTKVGTYAIKSNGSGLSESLIDINVQAAQIDHLEFTSASQIITAGEISNIITGKIYDAYENEVTIAGDLNLNLSSSGVSGEFSATNSPWSPITSLIIATGQNSFSFFYKDSDADVVTITASSLYGSAVQSESIISGPLSNDAPTKLLFQSSPQTMVINSPVNVNFYLANDANQYTVAQGQVTVAVSSDSATGRFFDTETSSWVTSLDVIFEIDESVKSIQYKDSVSGTPTITIAAGGLASAQQQETVINGSIEKIVLEAAETANTVDRIPVLIKTMTNSDLPVAVISAVDISLSQSGSGNFYASAGSQSPISSTTFTQGVSEKTVYFQQTIPGNVTITADENPSSGWTMDQASISISSVPTRLKFAASPQTKQAGQQSDSMTVTLEDVYGNVSNVASDLTLHLSSSSQFGEFSISDSNWVQTDSVVMTAGSSSANFFYKDTLAGTQTLTASDVSSPAENPDTGYTNGTQQYNVTTSSIYSLNFITAENNLEIGQISPQITIQAYDQYGNAKIVGSDLFVYLYSTSATGKFSLSQDFSQPNLVTRAKISAGTSVANFYYRDLETNVSQLTVSDKNILDNPDTGILNTSQQVTVITGDVAKIVWHSVPSTIEEGDGSVAMVVKTTNSSGIEIPVLSDLTIYFSARYETASNGSFANDSDGPWGINSTMIATGSSRATFYYKDTIAGTPLIIVSDESPVIEGIDSGLTNASSYITIVQGAISKIVFNSVQQSVIANHPSTEYQIQTLNRSDVATEVNSDKMIYLRSSSASGEFSLNGQDWGINGLFIPTSSSIGSFYYRDAISGDYNITASDTLPITPDVNWINATQSVTVVPQQLDHFNVRNISDPQKQGTPSSIVVSPVDSDNYVIKEYAGTITTFEVLDNNGNPELAMVPDAPYTFIPAVDNGTKTFVNAVAFYSEGEKTFTVSDGNGIEGSQQNITVVSASSNPIEQIRFVDTDSPLVLAKRTASPLITVQTQDSQSIPSNTTAVGGYDVKIVSSLGSGQFSTNGTDWSSGEIILNIERYTNFATFYYKNSNNVDDELTAADWNAGTDDEAVSNDTLEVNVIAGQAEYLEITGSSSQIAGEQQTVTVTAKDQDGDLAKSYAGEKELVFSGADIAYTGQVPSCNNKDDEDIEFGSSTVLNFANGQAECELTLYREATAEIKTTDGTIDTFGNSSRNLSINVVAGDMNRNLSILSAIPNPQQIDAPVVASVLPKDIFGNISGQSSYSVALNVSGANTISQEFNYDSQTGYYQSAYTPQNSGTDLIRAMLNGSVILQDTEGASDGVFHETVEGSAQTILCNYLELDSNDSGNSKLVFDACVEGGDLVKSDELSKNSTRGTSVSKLELEADDDIDENFSGNVEINSSSNKPSGMELLSSYEDSSKYIPYVFLNIQTDADSDSIRKTIFRVIISNQWMESNSVANILALDEKDNTLEINQVQSSDDNTTFEISADRLPTYLAVIGQKKVDVVPDVVVEQPTTIVAESPEQSSIVEAVLNNPIVVAVKQKLDDNDSGSDDKEDNANNDKYSQKNISKNFVSENISKLFSVDKEIAEEITNAIAVVAVGAAIASVGVTTTTSFPMLSYMFGGLRSLTAVPYRRKQKWGAVYDSQTGEPISRALVIISDENGRVKETKNTDSLGVYSFLAPKGIYFIEVRKSGYIAPETSHIVSFETYYDNSYIPGERIDLEEEGIISLNVPMLRQEETLWQKIYNPATMTHTVFWAGFSFSVFALIINPSKFNIFIVVFFIINFIFNTFYKKSLKTGMVMTKDSKAAPFTTIKIFTKENHELVARTVTNEKGVYFIVVNEGEYILEAQNNNLKCVKEISLEKYSEIKEQLLLE